LRSAGPYSWIWLVGALVSGAAAVSLWFGAARAPVRDRAGYRWLAGAALLWCAGSIGERLFSGQLSGLAAPLTFADLLPLLALAPLAAGIVSLAAPTEAVAGVPGDAAARADTPPAGLVTRQFWADLADGYVMASALFVVGWLVLFGSSYRRSGEDPRTFLVGLVQPLAGVLVMSALLPLVAAAGRRAVLPYLALVAVTVGDALGVAARLAGGHQPSGPEQLAKVIGYVLVGAAPWVAIYLAGYLAGPGRETRGRRPPVGASLSALAAAAAAVLIVVRVTAERTRVEAILVLALGSAMLMLAVRVLGLLRESNLAHRAARLSGGRVRDLADRTSDMVLICDLDGTVRYASPSVAAYGYVADAIEGRNLADFVHPEDRPAGQREIRRVSGDEHGDSGESDAAEEAKDVRVPLARFSCRVRAADGTWRHVECTVSGYRQPGDPAQLLFTARDVSDQVALRQQVTHLTFHDRLTGLPNRAYLEERVADLLARREDAVAALFLDLDGFTAVNDSAGHPGGDLVLIEAARRLRAVVPAQHTLARWGGDEFSVLMESGAGAREVVDLAEQLLVCVAAEPFLVYERSIALTASVGVALTGNTAGDIGDTAGDATVGVIGTDGTANTAGTERTVAGRAADSTRDGASHTPGSGVGYPPGNGAIRSAAEDIMRNADVAMSRAKAAGGGRVEIFAAHMHADVVRRLELTSDLRHAVAAGQLSVEYQPIVDLATSRVTGVEAFARWWRDAEIVRPEEFLGLAEESGLVVPLGEWLLREVCGQLARWRAASLDIGVSVNISPRQIAPPRFAESVIAALRDAGVPPSALTVEVTEKVLVEHQNEAVRQLFELRRHGVRIAIDDFGTGYASLGSLLQLPVDIIKIDPSFVSGLGTDETLTLLTRAIIGLGHDLGVAVVAEGVERPRQLEILREMGCDHGQGFLLARPVAPQGVESMIRARAAGPDVPEQGKTPAPAP
jgi:diguanylate cyclase (GGDEF)-like protein/PAS domain S-box-containing protein